MTKEIHHEATGGRGIGGSPGRLDRSRRSPRRRPTPHNGNGQVFVLNEQDRCNPKDCTPRVQYLTNGALSGNTFMLGFGEDARGNIWALANETGIPFEETGLVMKLVPRCGDKDLVNGNPDPQTPPYRD